MEQISTFVSKEVDLKIKIKVYTCQFILKIGLVYTSCESSLIKILQNAFFYNIESSSQQLISNPESVFRE